jgi:hypothetical protein
LLLPRLTQTATCTAQGQLQLLWAELRAMEHGGHLPTTTSNCE